ncbi:SUN domain-containing protein 1 [Chanos chanos]|uniref:SUN domain-containing protein 1 n=1 Tax=Chanos chanos TaxID=29144 RepID=A0A6J2VDN6_CHACN|nr:SUN domain-containing protein 1-like [Chanos chanos]
MDVSKAYTYTTQQCAQENTGYTYSSSSSYSSTALDFERAHRITPVFDTPRMSRRSLRLNTTGGHYGDSSLLDSSLNHTISYSARGSGPGESRTLKSRRSHYSASGSASVLQTPHKNQSASASVLQAQNSSLHSCAASDASLLSSLLDESCIQERTLVDSFWGLDEDVDHKDQSKVLANGDITTAQTQTSMVNSYACKECNLHTDRKDEPMMYSSTSKFSSSSSSNQWCSTGDGTSIAAGSPPTTVYQREKSRRQKTGVITALSAVCSRYRRALSASILYVYTLFAQSVLPRIRKEGKGVLGSAWSSCVQASEVVAESTVSALRLIGQCAVLWRASNTSADGAHSSFCGSVNVKGQLMQEDHMDLNGALWFGLLRLGQGVLSAGWMVTQKTLSAVWSVALFSGKAVSGAFWWLGTAWYQLVSFMCLLNVHVLARYFGKLLKFLLCLLPFILPLALWYSGPRCLLAFFLGANNTEWQTDSIPSYAHAPVGDAQRAQPPMAPALSHTWEQGSAPLSEVDSERMERLEQRLVELWERVAGAGARQEQQHAEVLGLYGSLREEFDRKTDKSSMEPWLNGLLEDGFGMLKAQLDREAERTLRQQDHYAEQQRTQGSRLSEMETLLQTLALQTEEIQKRQEVAETVTPVTLRSEGDGSSHAALLAEVQRLEEALSSIRAELQGLMPCHGRCAHLDSLHETVSLQVRQELRTLFFGGEEAEFAELPDSLLQWLSTQFIRGSDLQALLGALEQSILANISLETAQSQQPPSADAVTQTVLQTINEAGLSEEHVQKIVENALRLYSQDRIGLVDYALESGGGSILSTRCSETYETKTALMSLFGLPLWYFSQSPRVVIQPDVHPGNCWAFKGSHGYLVIRLSMKILPTAFSLEHIPKALSPTGNISSAPQNFTVYGLDDEQQEEGQLLGHYTYKEDGDPLQTYPVTEKNTKAFHVIELQVLSNWGHPEYTCLYRFRVHGQPLPH